jgi:hypothetical protein
LADAQDLMDKIAAAQEDENSSTWQRLSADASDLAHELDAEAERRQRYEAGRELLDAVQLIAQRWEMSTPQERASSLLAVTARAEGLAHDEWDDDTTETPTTEPVNYYTHAITEADRTTIYNALVTAATHYSQRADECRETGSDDDVYQYDGLADHASALATKLKIDG